MSGLLCPHIRRVHVLLIEARVAVSGTKSENKACMRASVGVKNRRENMLVGLRWPTVKNGPAS